VEETMKPVRDIHLSDMLKVSIREYLVSIIEERDRLYDTRFKAAEVAVSAALAAQEKSVTAAFTASEKAIVKAEDAQKDYNNRSNEFRGQLDDQAKTLMPRNESQTLFRAYDEKLESNKVAFEKSIDALIEDIKSLRESRSATAGASLQRTEVHQTNQWVIGLVIGAILAVVQIALRLAGK
jgi:hypothetical protein